MSLNHSTRMYAHPVKVTSGCWLMPLIKGDQREEGKGFLLRATFKSIISRPLESCTTGKVGFTLPAVALVLTYSA